MWKSHIHDDLFGPKAALYRCERKGEEVSIDRPTSNTKPLQANGSATEPTQHEHTTLPNSYVIPERNASIDAPARHTAEPVSSEPYPGT
jgi:hypothetical protein